MVIRPASDDVLESEPFREIADAAPVGLWRIDASFERDWVNKHWLDYTGGSLDEESAFAWIEKVHPEDRETVVEEFDRAFDARRPAVVEFRLRGRDGTYRWFRDSGAPYHRNGKFAGFVGTCIDITDRKQAETQRSLLETELITKSGMALNGMLAAAVLQEVSHPLGEVLAWSDALNKLIDRSGDASFELVQVAGSIRQSAERARRLVSECGALFDQRDTKGRSEDLAGVLRSIEPLLLIHPAAAGMTINWDLPSGLLVRVSRTQIEQVLVTLAINGLDAMAGRTGGALGISVARWGQYAVVSVADSGPGIPLEARDKIFDPAAGGAPAGLGMSLHVCRLIVATHAGRIWVDDNPAGGATVRFTLPLDMPEEI